MRTALIGLLFSAALPMGAGAVELTPNPDGPPVDSRTPQEIERDRLAMYKLAPLAEEAKQGRDIRRVTFQDMLGSAFAPAIVFEKMANGEVAMTVTTFNGQRIDRATLKPAAWDYLTAKDDAFTLRRSRPLPRPTEICHGTSAVIEASKAGKTMRYDAAVCNGAVDTPAILYARRLARVAIDAIPVCATFREYAREPSWPLKTCLRDMTIGARGGEAAAYNSTLNPVRDEVTNFAITTKTEITGEIKKASRDDQ